MLIATPGIDVNARCNKAPKAGMQLHTALGMANSKGHTEAVRLLKDAGATM